MSAVELVALVLAGMSVGIPLGVLLCLAGQSAYRRRRAHR